MKKILLLCTIALGLFACNSKNAGNGNSDRYKDISVAEFKARMAEPDVVLLDVRTPEETAEGMIEGAIEIDFYEDGFKEKIAQMDTSKTYLIYCRSGNRSGKTCRMMSEKGFKKLYNMEGGYKEWKEKMINDE